jgi:hypothetical protein
MAGVDLYGSDAGRIRTSYQTALQRDASDDEVSGWLSGSYGGGGIDDWVRQISGSHEAQQYQPQQPAPTLGQPQPGVSHGYEAPQQQAPQQQSDPWAQARQGLEGVYQQFLGRSGGGDVDTWLSGGFGYGSGLQDYDKYVSAIMSSPEARAYRPQATAGGAPQSMEYWQSQGTPAIDIFDPTTGQLRPGWARTAQGYARTGATGSQPNAQGGPQGGNFQSWFQTLTGGKAPTPQSLKAMEPLLNQYGIRLGPLNGRGFTDGIILPDGTFVDVIIGATENGGSGWGWITGGGGAHGGVGGGPLPPNQYNDPNTALLESLLKARIGTLQGGYDDPMRQMYMQAMDARQKALGTGQEPEYLALIKRLEDRFAELQGPGYTGAENEVLRTQALDPIENDRTAARQRVMERLSARGITPDSGIAQQALLEVDKAFDAMRATTQTTLASSDIQRREGRAQRADSIRGTLYDIPQGRAREQLDLRSAMELLENSSRQEDASRSREAIGYGGALADLGPQRMQLAMQAAGMGGNPQGMFNSLMQMAQLNQNSALLNQQNSGQLWSGLGSLAYTLMNAGR